MPFETYVSCQTLLFQGPASKLPQLLGDNLVALVIRMYPIWVNMSLLQIYFNLGHIFIAGCRSDMVIDLLYVGL